MTRALVLVLLWTAFAAMPAFCDFENGFTGARPAGMGGAFAGMADDSLSMGYNPAGLGYLNQAEVSADYGRSFLGLEDHSDLSSGRVALALPLRPLKSMAERVREVDALEFRMAASTESADSPAMDAIPPASLRRDWGALGLTLYSQTLSGAVSENTGWISYGRALGQRAAAGVSVKLLYEAYQLDDYTRKDPVFASGSRSDLLRASVDAGVLYNLAPRVFWGAALTDLNQPNVALNPADREILPTGLRSGLAYKDRETGTDLDVLYRDGTYKILAGAERWFQNHEVALRGGGGFGSQDYKGAALGLSANWKNVRIDYAFVYPLSGLGDPQGSHQLAFVYRFGQPAGDALQAGSLELYYAKLQQRLEAVRTKLERTEQQRESLEGALLDEVQKRQGRAPAGAGPAAAVKASSAPAAGETKVYVTLKGDTLQSVSELFYGDRDRWIDIYHINKEKIGKGGKLKKGTTLFIPMPSREPEAPLPLPAPKKPAPAVEEKPRKKTTPARPKAYQVQEGDTLSSIAQKLYGDPNRWKDIYNANQDEIERGSVVPGEILTIP